MDVPKTQFATTSDGVRIAYQDFGEGPPVVFCGEWISNQELQWDGRENQRVLEYVSEYVRFVTFDTRGIGLSDRFEKQPTIAERLADITAVLEAAGLESAGLYGMGTGGKLAVHFAAEFPSRVTRIVLDSMPSGPALSKRAGELGGYDAQSRLQESRAAFTKMMENWGVDARDFVALAIPSRVGDDDLAEYFARFLRMSATRPAAIRQMAAFQDLEIKDALARVTAPTLVAHNVGDQVVPVGSARAVAESLPHATLREFSGDDDTWWYAPYWRDIMDELLAFLTGREVETPPERAFAVVLFTDIVNSTGQSAALGDQAWTAKLERHDQVACELTASVSGNIVKSTGDGLLMTFESPTTAVDYAAKLRDRLRSIGLEIRAGLHGGDIELRGADISGAVVNLAARVEQAASDGEIFMTTAIREMVMGSGHSIETVGAHSLKGFVDDFVLHRLID